jgi:hypothetical protein
MMLIFESLEVKQRTYLVKTDEEFFIINDNNGRVNMCFRQCIENFKFELFNDIEFFKIKFLNCKTPMLVTKSIFNNSVELLKEKLLE